MSAHYIELGSLPTEAEAKMDESIPEPSLHRSSSSKSLDFEDFFCGRDEEILQLERIFRCTASGRASIKYPPLVLVGGDSGAGKSTLVSKAKEHLAIIEEEMFWINGKFEDQQHQQSLASVRDLVDDDSETANATDSSQPFAAIVDAFTQFSEEFAEEEPDTLEEVQDDIIEALGHQGSVLTNLIPGLVKIIGEQQQKSGEMELQVDLAQFHLVFKNFIKALATKVRTVVLVLDDIFRADAASLELLHFLLTSKLKHVMVIGTFRSNEVDDEHRFTKWINKVKEAQTEGEAAPVTSSPNNAVTKMVLSGMDLETVNRVISEVMALSPDDTLSLALIVHTKTKGNTFFVIQYLVHLHRNHLLWYDDIKKCWEWDELAVREDSAVSTTLLDFMKDKLQQSQVAPKLLPVAASLGAKFNQDMLETVITGLAKVDDLQKVVVSPDNNIADILKACEKEGFIVNCVNKTYSFVHDKIQEAALSLHPAITMQRIRYEAGTILYQQMDEKELDDKLFVVVNLLNVGYLKNKAVDRLEVAQLNLKAARRAKQVAAFSSASTYIDSALLFFPRHEQDESKRAFLLELCSLGAEVELATGNTGRMEKYCDMIINNNTESYNIFEQLRAQNVLLDSTAHKGGQCHIALKQCITIMEMLGCKLPKTTIGQATRSIISLLKSKSRKNIPTLEDVDQMELMTDLSKLEAMRLLERAALYAFLDANPLLFIFCNTRMGRWTTRYGLSEKSSAVYGTIGQLVMHVLGDYTAGTMYGELALSVMDKLEGISAENESNQTSLTRSRSKATWVTYGHVLCWVRPLKDYQDELVAGYHAGMQAGETADAMTNVFFHIGTKFSAGTPLGTLEELCRKGILEMVALQRCEAEVFTRVNWQSFLNLMNVKEGTTNLSGSAMNEKDYFGKEGQWSSKLLPIVFEGVKTMLYAFFGEYEEGAKRAIAEGDSFYRETAGSSWGLLNPLFRGVCLYAAGRTTRKRIYRKHAGKVRATLQSWVQKGLPNAVHQLKLLDAEHEACFGKPETARELYEVACDSASADGFIHSAALSNVRFAEFLLSSPLRQDVIEGKSRLDKAIVLYEKWGAKAVIHSLAERHGDGDFAKFNDEISVTDKGSSRLSIDSMPFHARLFEVNALIDKLAL